MKIAVLAASGKVGKLLVKEVVSRGIETTAFVRDANKQIPNVTNVVKDIFAITYDDLKEYDVIIDAFGTWSLESLHQHQSSLQVLIDALKGKPNRLLVVGGAGSLYLDDTHTQKLMDSDTFPEDWKPLAQQMGLAFENLKKQNEVNWTYLSPAAIFDANGQRSGTYNIGKDEVMVNHQGDCYISYADYAIAMVDEAVKANHIKQQFTVVSK
ncbi:NADH-flavin reductase [Erysipelotrichaceae bacterium MTC7]|nr:NADH-flavin reductase [Erysipelotrichaceae bacterium MTC7]